MHVVVVVVGAGSVGRRARQLPGGRAAGRQPEAPRLDVAAEGRPHLRGQEHERRRRRRTRRRRHAFSRSPTSLLNYHG